jgi:hypothetical protein
MRARNSVAVALLFGASALAQMTAPFMNTLPSNPIQTHTFDAQTGLPTVPIPGLVTVYDDDVSISGGIIVGPGFPPPPPPPVTPNIFADDLVLTGAFPSMIRHIQFACYNVGPAASSGATSIRFYSGGSLPPSAGGSASQLGPTILIPPFSAAADTPYVINIENINIVTSSPQIWLEIGLTNANLWPVVGSSSGPQVGGSNDLFAWNGAGTGGPPGAYWFGGPCHPRGDFFLEVAVPAPGVLPLLIPVLMIRRRRAEA